MPNKCVCGFAIVTVNAMFTGGGVCAAAKSGNTSNNAAAHTTRRLCMNFVHFVNLEIRSKDVTTKRCDPGKVTVTISRMFRRIIATSPTWITVPIRLALAAVMIAHGSQKVLGTFNGPGFTTYISGTTPLGFMRPAWFWLSAAAFSEFLGGILVGLGFLTRVGAFFIACVMVTAIAGVHWPGGFFAANRGYEYPLTLLAMSLALLISGGGQASIDRALSGGSGGRGRR